jgi:hypothetical protein
MVMKYELLPNEILIECFEYLNAFEIFYSFDSLNYRFYKLIRNISLCLDFQYVRKTIFDQFCRTMKLEPNIKQQIYSLNLSDKDTCGQIERFLSFFSLDEFLHLRSLTLSATEEPNVEKLKSMLPLMSQLRSFRICSLENKVLTDLPISNLRILSVPTLQSILTDIDKTSMITYLTVSGCSLDQLLCQLFKYAPLLKYLNVTSIYKSSRLIKTDEFDLYHNAIHLKQIIINSFEYSFDEFEIFVKFIPNLKSLTISTFDNICMIDAYQWERLIITLLPQLKIFQFAFGLYCRGKVRIGIIEKFKQFQNAFWCKQHQWYIEYVLDSNSAVIYTIPYAGNAYRLTFSTEKHSNQLINNLNTFDNVKDLTLCNGAISEKCYYYFSNVTSLKLESTIVSSRPDDDHRLRTKDIKPLQMIVNLYNLKHLDISSYFAIETSSLSEILKQSSQLSSLTINPFILLTLFNDSELCNYLNKMITKLDIYKFGLNSFNNPKEIEQFCEIFSNLEQLICNINQSDHFLILLNNSPKLSIIRAYMTPSDNAEEILSWFKNVALQSNIIYRINHLHIYADEPRELYNTELCIWTGESTN